MPRLAPGRSLLAAPLTVRRLTVCRAPARFTVRRAPARFVVAAAARLTAAALILLVAARPAAAQPAGNLTLDPFRPPIDAHGYLTVNGSQSLSHRELSFGLGALGWGHRLLTLDGAGNAYAIDDVITATLVAAVGLRVGPAALELGASLPLAIVAGSRGMTTTADGRTYRVDGQGVGDLGLHVKATLLRPRRGRPLGVAALAGVYLPTASTRDRFLGEAQVVPQLVGIADVELGRLRLAINGGVRLRRTTTFTNSDPGPDGAPVTGRSITASSELPFGVAAAYAVARQRLELIGEVFGAVPLGAHEAYQPLEAVAGLKVYLAQSSYLSLGVGRGLVAHTGANPDARAFISIVFEPGASDRDGDGLRDDVDACPDAAEDFDGFEDEDGCPDLDNDHDLIPDVDDKCPDLAEDRNGVEDADGCPEHAVHDRDGDGIRDELDRCPDVPEDLDGFEDADGCPDPDNDHDRIPDVDDRCPNEPETVNGYQDADGCPDRGVARRVETGIETMEPINFEYDSAVIAPDSFHILDAVVATLNGNPDIALLEVQGHTDERGDDVYNLELSDRRAASVMRYLVGHGVDARRLTAQGYGETQPIERAHTPAAWARNRRVDFVLRTRRLD